MISKENVGTKTCGEGHFFPLFYSSGVANISNAETIYKAKFAYSKLVLTPPPYKLVEFKSKISLQEYTNALEGVFGRLENIERSGRFQTLCTNEMGDG
jgi:hypothetical protein